MAVKSVFWDQTCVNLKIIYVLIPRRRVWKLSMQAQQEFASTLIVSLLLIIYIPFFGLFDYYWDSLFLFTCLYTVLSTSEVKGYHQRSVSSSHYKHGFYTLCWLVCKSILFIKSFDHQLKFSILDCWSNVCFAPSYSVKSVNFRFTPKFLDVFRYQLNLSLPNSI